MRHPTRQGGQIGAEEIHSSDSHELLITIEDNYGTKWDQTFEFNGGDSDDDGSNTGTVIGTITPISLTSTD